MEINVGIILKSCAESLKLTAFDWLKKESFAKEEWHRKMNICKGCPLRIENRCGDGSFVVIDDKTYRTCSCFIYCKAAEPSNLCPNNFWEVGVPEDIKRKEE